MAEYALPNALWRGKSGARIVALTFDDGPDPVYTPQLLDILRRYGIRATFFLVGERVRQYPELLASIRAGGHEIGNHSDTWRHSRSLSEAEFEEDLLRAEASLGLRDASPKLFRPAGGIIGRKLARIARRHDYTLVLASALPFDVYRPPAGWIAFLVRRSLRPGAIVVVHDAGGDRSRSVAAVPRIIEAALERKLRFVTVSEIH
jgi:peptidoglycan/xylan/chitin deacetylase (PgdA/CDA1 family)